ncbi:mind the gap [Carabus blaptoides fortunei]
MRCARLFIFLIVVTGTSWHYVQSTCVLDSEFGFTLNCAFKKSGLFRVRNLGGIKAHVGVGFTVGDELGFKESLSNVEGNRRRSTQTNGLQNALLAAAAQKNANNRKLDQQPSHMLSIQTPKLNMNKTIQPSITAHAKSYNILSATLPPFKPIPPAQERPVTSFNAAMNKTNFALPKPTIVGVAVPVNSFSKTPVSISRIATVNGGLPESVKKEPAMTVVMNPAQTLPEEEHKSSVLQTSPNSLKALAAISNISVEAIENAILQRQQQLMKQKRPSTTTTQKPYVVVPKQQLNIASKVMNAPREYYPVGYNKNFDDNFASKVELPETSFYCGDQKHFPGLYADEDLGCMVFHVCALTDDGLIMKSFLCPESTLFDQVILKCNWWFYVDCKNSKKMYDSNIPISTSYQLMKALTFFSSYKKDQQQSAKN